MRKLITVAFCSVLLLAAIPASADEWNKKTTITFGQPVEVPGMVLPAGTYVFKLADSVSDRHIVLVYNADETKLLKIILAIDNYRLIPKEKTVLTFSERRKDAPMALRAWFSPGDDWGQEFVYPKARAQGIAQEAREPVLSAEVEPAEEPTALLEEQVAAIPPSITAIEPEVAAEPEAVAETEIETEEAAAIPQLAQGEPAPAGMVQALPQTGSMLPLMALLGAGSLALGGLLKLRRAR